MLDQIWQLVVSILIKNRKHNNKYKLLIVENLIVELI